jgi:serine/threonine protein kinase
MNPEIHLTADRLSLRSRPTESDGIRGAQSSIDAHPCVIVGNDQLAAAVVALREAFAVAGEAATTADETASSSFDPSQIGQDALLGQFKIVRLIGHGGYGLVFLAIDSVLGRRVALKIPRPESLIRPQVQEEFLREARAAAALNHPNIVTVYGTGKLGPVAYIASEYCDGPSLAHWLNRPLGPIDACHAAQIVSQLACAVGHAHARGIIHRDLKPANVLLSPMENASPGSLSFSARITDFGLAKRTVDPDNDPWTGLIGTVPYMAPEQLTGKGQDICVQTDVYAMGAILYELLTGQRPFADRSGHAWRDAVCNEALPPMTSMRHEVPLDLEAVCRKCLAKAPADRYPTATELGQDLQRFLNGFPVAARPVMWPNKLWRFCCRRPVITALSAAILLTSIVGFGATFWQWRLAKENLIQSREHLGDSQRMLARLGWALDESYFWNDSPYQFDEDFRQSLNREFQQLIDHEQQFPAGPEVTAMAHRRLAEAFAAQGENKAADDHYRASIGLWHDLLNDQPGDRIIRRSLVLTLYYWAEHRMKAVGSGPREQVADLLQGKLIHGCSLGSENDRYIAQDFADLFFRRGMALRTIDIAAAVGTLQSAVDLYGAIDQALPPSANSHAERMVEIYEAMGECYVHISRLADGEFNYVAARRILEQFHPLDMVRAQHLATLHEKIGEIRRSLGNDSAAVDAFVAGMRIYAERAMRDKKDVAAWRRAADLAWDVAKLANKNWTTHDVFLAWQRCSDYYQRLLFAGTADPVALYRFANALRHVANSQIEMGMRADAVDSLIKSAASYGSITKSATVELPLLIEYGETLQMLAEQLKHKGDTYAAKQAISKAVQVYEDAQSRNAVHVIIQTQLEESRRRLASY